MRQHRKVKTGAHQKLDMSSNSLQIELGSYLFRE